MGWRDDDDDFSAPHAKTVQLTVSSSIGEGLETQT